MKVNEKLIQEKDLPSFGTKILTQHEFFFWSHFWNGSNNFNFQDFMFECPFRKICCLSWFMVCNVMVMDGSFWQHVPVYFIFFLSESCFHDGFPFSRSNHFQKWSVILSPVSDCPDATDNFERTHKWTMDWCCVAIIICFAMTIYFLLICSLSRHFVFDMIFWPYGQNASISALSQILPLEFSYQLPFLPIS